MRKPIATKRRISTSLAEMSRLLTALHESIATRALEGFQDRWDDSVGEIADRLWMEHQRKGVSPHLCPDRYCDCHVTLWQRRPPQLPLDDLTD